MTYGGSRSKSGRKSKMDQMNYWGWMQDLMVAYLNEPTEQVRIERPVQAFVRSNGIMLSLSQIQLVFGRPGYEHFHTWFSVKEQGTPESGNSVVAITTHPEIRAEIYKWLVETGSVDLIHNSCFVDYEKNKGNFLARHRSMKSRFKD